MKISKNPAGFLIIAALVAALWLIGTISGKGEIKTIDFTPSEQTSSAQPFKSNDPQLGTEGDQLELNGTVILVGRIWASDTPNPILGDRTCAPVVYRNMGDEPIQVSQFDWKLTTPAGLTLDAAIGGATKMLPFGAIEPRGATEGHVCFATKHENRGLWKLTYKPSVWTNGSLTWTNQ